MSPPYRGGGGFLGVPARDCHTQCAHWVRKTQGAVLCVIDLNAAKDLAKAEICSFSKRKLNPVTERGDSPPDFLSIAKA